MAFGSTIEWTDATWNPVRGCTKVSPGCAHCYAETFAERFRGVPGHPYEFGFDLMLVPDKLAEPFRWRKSSRVFVNSMSDLFDLLRTKLSFVNNLPHIWWGVSVENRKHGLPRIEHLREAPAAVRFLSIEPLLEDLGPINLSRITWTIVGGESGAGARPIRKEWVVSIRDQCARAGVSFFFKQWGGVRKSENGRRLSGRTYDGFPQIPFLPVMEEQDRRSAIAELTQLYERGLYSVRIPGARAVAG